MVGINRRSYWRKEYGVTATETKEITYHEIFQRLFEETQNRMNISQELFKKAQERKKKAVLDSNESEVETQVQTQQTLNDERACLSNIMEELVGLVKTNDQTVIPKLTKYILYSKDQIKLIFKYQNKKEEGEAAINCNVTHIFHKTCRSQVLDMNKSKKKTYIERGIDFTLSFRTDDLILFMTNQEFYDIRSKLIGSTGITQNSGNMGRNGIQDIQLDSGELKINICDANNKIHEYKIGEPIAVAVDYGAIWQFEPNNGSFDWLFFKKDIED